MNPLLLIAHHQFPDIEVEKQVLQDIGAHVQRVRDLAAPAVEDMLRKASGVMVATEEVPASLVEKMDSCRIISRVGTGLDAIDIEAATKGSIWVTNVPDYAVDEVATHTIMLLLAHARRLPIMLEAKREGSWDPLAVRPFSRLSEQTLGLFGFGRIGKAVATKGRGIGLQIIVHDPYVDARDIEAVGAQSVDWQMLLRIADYISLHTPLTEATHRLIDTEALALMKTTSFLINTARGALVDEDALLNAIRHERIAGAALDVLAEEPPLPTHPLWCEDRVIVTPHIGWYSEDSGREVRVKASEEVVRVLSGKKPLAPVNQI